MPTKPRNGSSDKAPPLAIYILAGGKSTRYGSDKARAVLQGTPLIVRILQLFAPLARSVTAVAREAGAYDSLGVATIGDVVRNKGPMGGVLTALEHRQGQGWIFVTACDWVGFRAEWIHDLWRRRSLNCQAVVFRSAHYEPLFALYHTSLRDELRARISAGELGMQELLAHVRTVEVPVPSGWDRVSNVNAPDDLPR